jgi:glycosyltransferase involved in cell wall biosynthesis
VEAASRCQPCAPRPRKVLYVEGNLDGTIGGSFFSLLFLVTGLDRKLYLPVVVFYARNPLLDRFKQAGIDTRVIVPRRPITLRSLAGRWISKAANFIKGFVVEPLQIACLLRREGIDIVHLNNSITSNHVWMLAARFARVACVSHERGINASFSGRSRWLGRGLDAVICISGAVQDNFARAGLYDLKLNTIYNGLDPEEMAPRRSRDEICQELGVDSAKRFVGIVGNVRHWKGQEVVIRALSRLGSKFDDVVCLIIGDADSANQQYRDHITNTLNELGLGGRVVITGYKVRVADYISVLEVLIHASVMPEPFGRVLLEGMALRKPIVASRGGAVPEVVVHEVTGLLFSPGNHDDLAASLERLLDDPEGAAAMGVAGYERLMAEFSIEQNVRATESLYERVLESRATHRAARRV